MSYNEELQSNNEALRDILDEVNALPDGTGGVQADYAQNNPAARDYIKNRPFYDSREWVPVHTEAQTSPEGGTPSGQEYSTFTAESPNIFELYPVGTTVKCVIDGVEYVSTIRESSRIGNYGLVSAGDNTGEPFCLFGTGATIGVCVKGKPAGAYTVSVYALEGELKKIGSQFLPDSMQPDWNQNDPAAKDYIKNRPFYRVQHWKCVQEPQVIDVQHSTEVDTGELGFLFNFDHFLGNKYPNGTVFKLIVGDDEYIGTYKADDRTNGGGYVGNGGLYTQDSWANFLPDTGEDFLIVYIGVDGIGIVTRKPLTVCEVSVYMLEGEELVVDPQYASLLSGGSKPYVIDAEAYTYGDDALAAILAGRQIYVKVPSQSPGGVYANFMPVIQYQLPQSGNDYLTLLYLKDGIAQNIMAALQTGSFDAVYGQIVMLLSQSYDDCPLKVSPIK